MPARPLITTAAVVLLATLSVSAASASDPLYDELPPERVLYVAPGQTLDRLVRRAYPGAPDRWAEIREWIVANNPHAFIEGEPSRLRGDVRLQLPRPSQSAAASGPEPEESGVDRASGQDRALVFDGRFLFVNPSQSLEELVPRVYPDHPDRWQEIVEAIVEQNRAVMEDRDTRRAIRRGTRLSIPSVRTRPAAADGLADGAAAGEAPPQPVVGEVVSADGAITATAPGGGERALGAGSPVRRGDTVATAPAATAAVAFNDGERLHLRPGSRIRVRAWELPDVGPGRRVIGLLAGGLRAVTGAIGNRGDDVYRTVTPAATMGIRGTDYTLRLCGADECRDARGEVLREGLYVGVAAGGVELLNGGGDAVFLAGEYGYVADADTAPAQLGVDAAPGSMTGADAGSRDAASESGDDVSWWLGGGLLLLLLAL